MSQLVVITSSMWSRSSGVSCVASMSHEIRTPLNAIVGFSDVLATQDTPEEREHILDVITTNCDMLLRLVNDMLALSSLDNGDIYIKPARLNFTNCFADVTASLARRVQNPLVEYIVENPYPKLYTTLDGGRIQQVITNFVTNAIKYTHCDILAPSAVAEGNIFLSRECASIAERFL